MASDSLALLNTVQGSLETCFRVLQEQHEAWKNTLVACTPLLASLANLAEQMQASRNVPFTSTLPLRDFPCLQEKLLLKQQCAAEAVLEELQDRLADLQKVRDAVCSHVAHVLQLCKQPVEGLRLESYFQRSAICPSLVDMLEWLLDAERFYHHIYLEVRLLLLQVNYEKLTEMQTLPQTWEKVLQHSLQNPVEDLLVSCSLSLRYPAESCLLPRSCVTASIAWKRGHFAKNGLPPGKAVALDGASPALLVSKSGFSPVRWDV
ncbi:AFG2-interacting ribosome maturation factor isoform X2 [Tiliqua scincoides]